MCEDCFAAIITVASIFWIEYLLFEPPRYGGSFFRRLTFKPRGATPIQLCTTITMAAAKTTCESCAGSSGDFLPPSSRQGEKTSHRGH